MDIKVKYWMHLSKYDLETAIAMFETKRYIYVGFMCHQCIEKILKAYWQSKKDVIPPKTHNLSYLISETGLLELISDEQLVLLDELEPLNIECRYPEYKDKLFKRLNMKMAKQILERTEEFYLWIRKALL